MSFYDCNTNNVIKFDTVPVDNYPGWVWIDCGCSGGLEWGSGYGCDSCNCSGMIAKHIKTGTLAQRPGGSLLGKELGEVL